MGGWVGGEGSGSCAAHALPACPSPSPFLRAAPPRPSFNPKLPPLTLKDMSTRLWDLRWPAASFALLRGQIGAVRSLRFSADGRFLAAAEPADYVTLYDAAAG